MWGSGDPSPHVFCLWATCLPSRKFVVPVLEICCLCCGNLLSLLWKFGVSVVEICCLWCRNFLSLVGNCFVPIVLYCNENRKFPRYRDNKFLHQRWNISTPVLKVFVHAGPGHMFGGAQGASLVQIPVGQGVKMVRSQVCTAAAVVFRLYSYPTIEANHFHTRDEKIQHQRREEKAWNISKLVRK